VFFDKQHRFFFFLCGKGKGALETKTRELSRRAADKREKSKKKREKRRGRALSKTFPSLSPVLLPHIIAVSFCLYLEREKRTTEKTRESPRRRRERETFFSLPFHRARGVDIHKTTSRKRKKKRASFFFSVSEN